MLFKLASIVALASYASAECPNACSGHGQCSNFDMCTCNRNFEGNDCSLRTCPFDRAHVDTSKGDLNGDQAIDATTQVVGSQVYPTGTPELYPIMENGNSVVLADTAHEYMECSNKGICDRNTGTCECFEGYDGAACNRASCPNSCSGHGTCESIAELAFDDFENIYALWDKESTMGCACDPGFSGPDCSERMCKYGIDPLYTDDTTARVQETHIKIQTSLASTLYGTYALKFYDVFGEDYVTSPIIASTDDTNQCSYVEEALKALPNDVIESVTCTSTAVNTNMGFDLKLEFITNPGVLKQMEIMDHLDGSQTSLRAYTGASPSTAATSTDGTYTTAVYQTGTTGAFIDYFASKCEGVEAIVTDDATGGVWRAGSTFGDAGAIPGSIGYLDSLTTAEQGLLKTCLGDSDGDMTNNVEVYNWDMGYLQEMESYDKVEYTIGSFPHAIMTVPVTQTTNMDVTSDYYGVSTNSGDFHLLWYDPSESNPFRIANFGEGVHANSYIHTTNGVVQQLGIDETGSTDDQLTTKLNETRIVGMFEANSNMILTSIDASCESGSADLHACLSKGDKLFVVDGCWGDGSSVTHHGKANNPDGSPSFFGDHELYNCATSADASSGTGNLYTIKKIFTRPFSANTTAFDEYGLKEIFSGREDRFVIKVDQNIGWDGSRAGDPDNTGGRNSGVVILFKFTPVTTGSYTYVSQCSNRGACNNEEGLCECFKGYHGDACQKQSSLAQ